MHPETHLQLQHVHAADLRAEADAYRLTTEAGSTPRLRARVGWTLVEVGLRLASAPRTAVAAC
ncbi:hypothetical protein CW362_34545 [Streptomyces populi]|uniref:Uncharacterized protein n=1 Tax=Streptomyces populi TaxID=2058924 RepID=A0A2I0SF30_9ACTN|nr:hypothetical protein [Streptomyces populi]PKT68509.1 hypothetical protein CW362_34545 [Streptomyces populi]